MTNHGAARLLADALAEDPSRPLVTFYDDATGERVELSVATFDNWVAKTANLLVDGLALGPGSRVALHLPLHWQTAVWLAACWRTGATVGVAGSAAGDASATDADLVVCGPEVLQHVPAGDEVVALSLRPLGARFNEALPPGVLDYAVEVPGYGDRYTGAYEPAATEVEGTTLSDGALVEAATDAAVRWGLSRGGRLLSSLEPSALGGLLATLPAALVTGGSVVLCRNAGHGTLDETARARRLADEKVTATAQP